MIGEVPHVSLAIEGAVDEAVAIRLIEGVGGVAVRSYGGSGKAHLLARLDGYNRAAALSPWFVLIDLDREECAPSALRNWLPTPSPLMRFRIVVREIEAWLLADQAGISKFLGVAARRIPHDPEQLEDPKQTLVELAGQSRSRAIRQDLVPRPRSGRNVGPAYSSRLMEFIVSSWRPEIAAVRAASLARCIERLGTIGEPG